MYIYLNKKTLKLNKNTKLMGFMILRKTLSKRKLLKSKFEFKKL